MPKIAGTIETFDQESKMGEVQDLSANVFIMTVNTFDEADFVPTDSVQFNENPPFTLPRTAFNTIKA